MNIENLNNKEITGTYLFSDYYDVNIPEETKKISKGLKEINAADPQKLSLVELGCVLIFLQENLVKLDFLQNANPEKNEVKKLRLHLIDVFSSFLDKGGEKIQEKIQKLKKKNKLIRLQVVLEATNEFELLKKFNLNNDLNKVNEFKSYLLYDMIYFEIKFKNERPIQSQWMFSNDIFGCRKEGVTYYDIVSNFLVKNNLKPDSSFLNSMVWFKCAVDSKLIDPTPETLKSFYLVAVGANPNLYISRNTIEERTKIFFDSFIKTDVCKGLMNKEGDFKENCVNFFKEEIAKSKLPGTNEEIMRESIELFNAFLKHQIENKIGEKPEMKKNKI